MRQRCNSCWSIMDQASLLRAANPFNPDDEIVGCPNCKQCDEGFTCICDEEGCDKPITCGWPSELGYRRTCYKHACF